MSKKLSVIRELPKKELERIRFAEWLADFLADKEQGHERVRVTIELLPKGEE
ncbi:MAG: hypothetical protein ACF8K1_05355 [Phycisphaerales bacterium JB047]